MVNRPNCLDQLNVPSVQTETVFTISALFKIGILVRDGFTFIIMVIPYNKDNGISRFCQLLGFFNICSIIKNNLSVWKQALDSF
ncbi:hypothetical protein D3C71_1971750 [compost metagenome]